MSIDLKIHEMAFTITETSAFRIYTEPHDVDVDVWLYPSYLTSSFQFFPPLLLSSIYFDTAKIQGQPKWSHDYSSL